MFAFFNLVTKDINFLQIVQFDSNAFKGFKYIFYVIIYTPGQSVNA